MTHPVSLVSAVMATAFLLVSPARSAPVAKIVSISAVPGLSDYLTRAFNYLNRSHSVELLSFPDIFDKVLGNIRLLQGILISEDAPEELIEVQQFIISELISYLKSHPDALYNIRPRQFEELIAEILAGYGWRVEITPATKDGGYDIYGIVKDEVGKTSSWLIECKRYAAERKVGVDIVRALYGSNVLLGGENNLMLATTSFFTKGVYDIKASRYDLELKDYEGILDWVNTYQPNPNGKLYLKDNELIVPGRG